MGPHFLICQDKNDLLNGLYINRISYLNLKLCFEDRESYCERVQERDRELAIKRKAHVEAS